MSGCQTLGREEGPFATINSRAPQSSTLSESHFDLSTQGLAIRHSRNDNRRLHLEGPLSARRAEGSSYRRSLFGTQICFYDILYANALARRIKLRQIFIIIICHNARHCPARGLLTHKAHHPNGPELC